MTTATTTYDIRRYEDASFIGTVELTAEQFASYMSDAQQPQGIIPLFMLSGELKFKREDQDTEITVYLE